MSTVLDLSKKFSLNLTKVGFDTIPTMRTRLAVDKSGSMDSLFRNGFVEKTIELFMGAAAKFDDNGELEYTFFNTSASGIKSVSINNYKSLSIPNANNGTNYVPALNELVDLSSGASTKQSGIFGSIFGKKDATPTKPEDPVYIGFITDGEPSDLQETVNLLEKLNGTRNFIQFIVLGNDISSSTQKALTKHSNTAVSVIKNPSQMGVDELYEIIANTTLLNWYKSL